MIEKIFEAGAKALGMCGHGKDHNWSVRIAERFFVDCPCCLFWRGVILGITIALALMLSVAAAIASLNGSTPPAPPALAAVSAAPQPDAVTLAAASEAFARTEERLLERINALDARINAQAEAATALLARIEAAEKSAAARTGKRQRKPIK